MRNRIICITISLIILICAVFVACSGNNNHTNNEKEVNITNENGEILTSNDGSDTGAVTVIEDVTNENGKVVGTKKTNQPTSVDKNGYVIVTRVAKVTNAAGKVQTTVIEEKVTDKNGNNMTVASASKSSTSKKAEGTTSAVGTTASNKTTEADTTKQKVTKKPTVTTTTDPCTTSDPNKANDLPEVPADDNYLLTENLGMFYLQQRYNMKADNEYIVNVTDYNDDYAYYTIYVPKKNSKTGHDVYSTVKVNLKNGMATETNAKSKKKTKYNVTELPTTTTTTTKAN